MCQKGNTPSFASCCPFTKGGHLRHIDVLKHTDEAPKSTREADVTREETTLLSIPHDPNSEVCGFWISLGIPQHPARSLEKGNGVTQGLLGARPRKCPKDVCPCAVELSQVQSYKGGWTMEQSLVPWRKRKWVLADPRSPHHMSVIA